VRHFWASTTQTVIHGRRHWGVMKFRCLRYIISAGDAVAMLALGGVASMAAAAMAPTPMLDKRLLAVADSSLRSWRRGHSCGDL
jgi:hypothetical protein